MKFKKYIIISFGILIFFLFSFFIGKITNSDLGKFPFESNVWGTFSDYLMISFTLLSLFIIYKTLLIQTDSIKEQSKSIEAQTQELRYAKLDRRKDFIVDFEITIDSHKHGEGEYILFKYENETTLRVETKFHSNPLLYDKLMRKNVPANKSFLFKAVYLLSKGQKLEIFLAEKISDQLTITLEFTDYYGFKYSKTYMFYPNGRKSSMLLKHLD